MGLKDVSEFEMQSKARKLSKAESHFEMSKGAVRACVHACVRVCVPVVVSVWSLAVQRKGVTGSGDDRKGS